VAVLLVRVGVDVMVGGGVHVAVGVRVAVDVGVGVFVGLEVGVGDGVGEARTTITLDGYQEKAAKAIRIVRKRARMRIKVIWPEVGKFEVIEGCDFMIDEIIAQIRAL